MDILTVIGGGLAGSEAAWQAAQRGIQVRLYEMRPGVQTGAHVSSSLGELVCSNSLGSKLIDRASGLLKAELRKLDSLVLACAEIAAVPAGGALAVDRDLFSKFITDRISSHPNIELVRKEVKEIPDTPTVVASGPLTSDALSLSIASLTGAEHLYFYDAISPIIGVDSINMEIAFHGSRYDRGDRDNGDYINCPFTDDEYHNFIHELIHAERIEIKSFEKEIETGVKAGHDQFFEGCLPVEILANRGPQSLAFGPLRPVGLIDPKTGRRPRAVLQLRQDNIAGSLYNMVGFQTNLTFPEQRRVFRTIPGLENAEFVRYGQMHRNTFLASPKLLKSTMQYREREDLFFAGQITGVEGYMGNVGTGLLAGWNAAQVIQKKRPVTLPDETMLGALCNYVTCAELADFQPMKANYGILPPLEVAGKTTKRQRAELYSYRSLQKLDEFIDRLNKSGDFFISTRSKN
jgi:methylenetetrahydrofolate--tRNA-(uracil-5-)-methyltransferase